MNLRCSLPPSSMMLLSSSRSSHARMAMPHTMQSSRPCRRSLGMRQANAAQKAKATVCVASGCAASKPGRHVDHRQLFDHEIDACPASPFVASSGIEGPARSAGVHHRRHTSCSGTLREHALLRQRASRNGSPQHCATRRLCLRHSREPPRRFLIVPGVPEGPHDFGTPIDASSAIQIHRPQRRTSTKSAGEPHV